MYSFLVAAEEGAEAGLPAWVIGVIAFVILMALLFILLSFGKGREHT